MTYIVVHRKLGDCDIFRTKLGHSSLIYQYKTPKIIDKILENKIQNLSITICYIFLVLPIEIYFLLLKLFIFYIFPSEIYRATLWERVPNGG